MLGLLLVALLGFLVAVLQAKGMFSATARTQFLRLARAATTDPLSKRGWQKKAAKPEFRLKPLEAKYELPIDMERLARYLVVCQIPQIEKFGQVPLLYPEMTCFATELLELMLSRDYPLPVMGSVHVRNWTRQTRPIMADEKLRMTVKIAPDTVAVKRGTEVTSLLTLWSETGEEVWRTSVVYLVMHRHNKPIGETAPAAGGDSDNEQVLATEDWRLPENIGRTYATVSLDFNPIHLYGWLAKLMGLAEMKPIAHGMYTAARAFGRCLDIGQAQLKYPLEAEVYFRRMVVLPSTASLSITQVKDGVGFYLDSRGKRCIDGSVRYVP